MTVTTLPGMSIAELAVMRSAAGAFLARQGIAPRDMWNWPAGQAHRIVPVTGYGGTAAGMPAGTGTPPGAGRGWWRWPGASGSAHENVNAHAWFSAAGITGAELEVMQQSAAAFLTALLGGAP